MIMIQVAGGILLAVAYLALIFTYGAINVLILTLLAFLIPMLLLYAFQKIVQSVSRPPPHP